MIGAFRFFRDAVIAFAALFSSGEAVEAMDDAIKNVVDDKATEIEAAKAGGVVVIP